MKKRFVSLLCAFAILLTSIHPGAFVRADGPVLEAPPPNAVRYDSNFDQWALSDTTAAAHDYKDTDRVHTHATGPDGWQQNWWTYSRNGNYPFVYRSPWVSEHGHWTGGSKADANGYIPIPDSQYCLLIGGISESYALGEERPYYKIIDVSSLGKEHRTFNISFLYAGAAKFGQDGVWTQVKFLSSLPSTITNSFLDGGTDISTAKLNRTTVKAGTNAVDISKVSISTYGTEGTTVRGRGIQSEGWIPFELTGELAEDVNYILIEVTAVIGIGPEINSAVANVHFDAGVTYKVEYKDEQGEVVSRTFHDPDDGMPALPPGGSTAYWINENTGEVSTGAEVVRGAVHEDMSFRRVADVIPADPAPGTEKPSNVPASYVKVTFDPTARGNGEKLAYWVNPNVTVTLTPPENPTPINVNDKFISFGNGVYTRNFSTDTTLTATYREIVLDKGTDDVTDPIDGYVRVIFDAGQYGTFAESHTTRVYWILRGTTWDKAKELGFADPAVTSIEKGYARHADKWKPSFDGSTPAGKPVGNKTFTAMYTQKALVRTENPSDDDYTTVTFHNSKDGKGTVTETTYWVLKTGLWKDVRADESFVPPAISPTVGYVVSGKNEGWDKPIPNGPSEVGGEALDYYAVVVPKQPVMIYDPQDEQYRKITFKPDAHSRINEGKTDVNYWVLKTITWDQALNYVSEGEPAGIKIPVITPDVGYRVAAANNGWDRPLPGGNSSIASLANDVFTSVTAMKTKVIPDVDPQDPAYVAVKFQSSQNGHLELDGRDIGNQKVYYVLRVLTWQEALADLMKEPAVKPNVGYRVLEQRWQDPVPKDSTEVYDFTFNALYERLPDVIHAKAVDKDDDRPTGYETIYFNKGEHGKLLPDSAREKYYFCPGRDLTLLSVTIPPLVKADTGFSYRGWDVAENTPLTNGLEITATYAALPDEVPVTEPKPDGYITIAYLAGRSGSFVGTPSSVVFANPKPGSTVGDLKMKPQIEPLPGYTFIGWDKPDSYVLQAGQDLTLTALYAPDVVPTDDPARRPDGTPESYVQVKVIPTDKSSDAPRYYFVSPGKEVSIPDFTPQGRYVPADDKTYVFTGWDRSLTGEFTSDMPEDQRTITAQYKEYPSIIPVKTGEEERPQGYVTVVYSLNGRGEHDGFPETGELRFYVQPLANKKLGDLGVDMSIDAVHPLTTEYQFKGWTINERPVTAETVINENRDILVLAKYSPEDVIPGTETGRVPKGRFRVAFDPQGGQFADGQNSAKYFYVLNGKSFAGKFPSKDTMTYAGHVFKYWSESVNGPDAKLTAETAINSEKTFYAVWGEKPPVVEGTDPNPPAGDKDYVHITFAADGGTFGTGDGAPTEKSFYVLRGKSLGSFFPRDVVRDTYTLSFWSDDPAGTPNPAASDIAPDTAFYEDDTFTAVWKKNQVEVRFHDELNPSVVTATVNADQKGALGTKFPQDPVMAGYRFEGYFSGENGTGQRVTADTRFDASSDVYASWKKIVVEESVPESDKQLYAAVVFKSGDHGRFPSAPAEQKTFYVLNGESWASAREAGLSVPVINDDSIDIGWVRAEDKDGWDKVVPSTAAAVSDSQEADRTFTAVYKELESIIPAPAERPRGYVTVNFHLDNKGVLAQSKPMTYYVNPEKALTIASLGMDMSTSAVRPIHPYVFLGWSKAGTEPIDGSVPVIDVIAEYNPKDVIPRNPGDPKTSDDYVRVIFEANGGEFKDGTTAPKNYDVRKDTNLGAYFEEVSGMRKEYHVFDSWWLRPADGSDPTKSDVNPATNFSEDQTFFAKWAEKQTIVPGAEKAKNDPEYALVRFIAEDGGSLSGDHTEFSVLKGQNIKLSEIPGLPTAVPDDKYVFNSWSENLEETAVGSTGVTVIARFDKKPLVVPGDLTTGPSADDDYVLVTFAPGSNGNLDGQLTYSVLKDSGVILNNREIIKPAAIPSQGYSFVGWDTPDSTEITHENLLVTAQWKSQTIAVTFNHNYGGEPGEPADIVKTGVAGTRLADFPADPVRAGFRFIEWNTKPSGRGMRIDANTVLLGNTDAYAVWKKVALDVQPDPVDTDRYTTITFDTGSDGSFADGSKQIVRWVLKDATWQEAMEAGMTVPEVPASRITIGKQIVRGDGRWSPALPEPSSRITGPEKYTAQYEDLNGTIPGDQDKPYGYVTVIFDLDGKGTHPSIPGGKISFHVNPKASPSVTLGDLVPNLGNVSNNGTTYKFVEWTVNGQKADASTEVAGTTDMLVIATYTEDNVIPGDKDQPAPDGRVKVTFEPQGGRFADQSADAKVYFVKTGAAFAGKLPAGMTREGYEFREWNLAANGAGATVTKDTKFDAESTVYAIWDKLVQDEQPTDPKVKDKFVSLTFDATERGAFADGSKAVTKWVYSGKTWAELKKNGLEIPQIPAENVEIGYALKNGASAWANDALPQENDAITGNRRFEAQYDKLSPWVPGTDPRPHGYIKVTFTLDGKGTRADMPQGETSFYVNPTLRDKLSLGDLGFDMNAPITGILDYAFKSWEMDGAVAAPETKITATSDVKVIATYTPRDVIVPAKPSDPTENGRVRVVFDPQGGMFADQSTAPKNFDVLKNRPLGEYFPEDMTKARMNFLHWSETPGGEAVELTKETAFTEAKTYYAVWEQKPDVIERQNPDDPKTDNDYVRVIFNATDGAFDQNAKTKVFDVLRGKTLGAFMPTNPTREDYDFAFWALTNPSSQASDVSGTTPFFADTEYYAQWSAQAVTVTFKYNYGANDPDKALQPGDLVLSGTKTRALSDFPKNPERKGYDFVEWNTSADGTGQAIASSHVFKADTPVYAIWRQVVLTVPPADGDKDQYAKLIFKAGDHGTFANGETEITRYVAKEIAKVPTTWKMALENGLEIPETPIDKIEVGYERKTGNEAWASSALPGENDVLANEMSFTAQYKALKPWVPGTDPRPYGYIEVTFTLDGKGTHQDIPNGEISFFVNPKANVSLGSLGIDMDASAVKGIQDYTFKEWQVEGAKVTAATAVNYDHDVKVIATYSPYDVIIPPTPDTPPAGDRFAVRFDPQGGRFSDNSTIAKVFHVYKDRPLGAYFPTADSMKKTGMNFEHWSLSPNGEPAELTAQTPITKAWTLYAVWTPKTPVIERDKLTDPVTDEDYVRVVFYGNEGEFTVEDTASNNDMKPQGAANANAKRVPDRIFDVLKGSPLGDKFPGDPTREHYDFLYWSKTKEGGKPSDVDATTKFFEKTEYYAQWEKQPVTVTFHYNYASGDADYSEMPADITINGKKTDRLPSFPQTPERHGYNFLGWNTKADGKGDAVTAESTYTANTDVYAIWQKIVMTQDPKDPANYVSVTFKSSDHAAFADETTEKTFWVVKNTEWGTALDTGVIVPEIPADKTQIGFERKAAPNDWKNPLPQTADRIAQNVAFTAQFDELDDIYDGGHDRPRGYIAVTFNLDGKGDHEQMPGGTVTKYVNPTKGIELGNIGIDMNDSAVKPHIGYTFEGWDHEKTFVLEGTNDVTVIALYNKKPVIPTPDPSVPPTDNRVRIIFMPEGGSFGDGVTGSKSYDVDRGASLGAYFPTGMTRFGHTFAHWSLAKNGETAGIDETTPMKNDATYYAVWTAKDAIVPGGETAESDPDYTTVTFVKGEHGLSLTGTTVYSVLKNSGILLGNDELAKPTANPEPHYKHMGWDKADTLEIQAAPVVVTALYKKVVITNPVPGDTDYVKVTFLRGEHGSLEGQDVFYVLKNAGLTLGYELIAKPAVHPDRYYEFTKWDKADNTPITDQDVTVTAQYKRVDVTISFNENWPGAPAPTKVQGQAGLTIPALPETPVRENYRFLGWNTSQDGTGDAFDKSTILTGDLEVFAVWKKIVTNEEPKPGDKDLYVEVKFDAGQHGTFADGTAVLTQWVLKDATREEAEKTGFVIPQIPVENIDVGYARKAGAAEWSPELPKPGDKMAAETYTAQYDELEGIIPGDETKPYGYITVLFDLDGKGTHKEIPDGTISFHVNPTKGYTLADLIDMNDDAVTANTGYIFEGWDHEASFALDGKDNVKVIALYDRMDVIPTPDPSIPPEQGRIRVIFMPEGGTFFDGETAAKSYDVLVGKALGAYFPESITRQGYTFEHWSLEKDGAAFADLSRETTFDKDATLYAVWNQKPAVVPGGKTAQEDPDYTTVTFLPGEHAVELTGETVVSVLKGFDVKLGDPSIAKPGVVPEKGYVHTGWDKPDTFAIGSEPVTVSAVCKPQIVTGRVDDKDYVLVTFDAGKHGTLAGQTEYSVLKNTGVLLGDSFLVKPEVTPDKDYAATGWDKPDTLEIKDQNVVVTATYRTTLIEITFNLNYSDDPSKQPETRVIKITEKTSLGSLLPTPVREGYAFTGWYPTPEAVGAPVGPNDPQDESRTLYAGWKLLPQPVKLVPTLDPIDKDHTDIVVGNIDPEADKIVVTGDGGTLVTLIRKDGGWQVDGKGGNLELKDPNPDKNGKLILVPKDRGQLEGKRIRAFVENTKDPKHVKLGSNTVLYRLKDGRPRPWHPAPKTGDATHMGLLMTILVMSLALLAFLRRKLRPAKTR